MESLSMTLVLLATAEHFACGLVWAQFAAPADAVYGATALFPGFVLAAAARGAFSSGNKSIPAKQGLPAALAAATVAFV